MVFTDYYAILKINRYATDAEIRAAYLERCKEWHPDKNPGVDTTKKMQSINQAKTILLDPAKRSAYNAEYNLHYARASKPPYGEAWEGASKRTGNTQANKERYSKLKNRISAFKARDEYMHRSFQEEISQKPKAELFNICTNWSEYSKEFLDLTVVALHEKHHVDLDTVYSMIKKRNARPEPVKEPKEDLAVRLFRVILWVILAYLARTLGK